MFEKACGEWRAISCFNLLSSLKPQGFFYTVKKERKSEKKVLEYVIIMEALSVSHVSLQPFASLSLEFYDYFRLYI